MASRKDKISKYIDLIEHNVILTCTDGSIFRGYWEDISDARDDEEQEEDGVIIDCSNTDSKHYGVYEIYESEIESIQLAK